MTFTALEQSMISGGTKLLSKEFSISFEMDKLSVRYWRRNLDRPDGKPFEPGSLTVMRYFYGL